MASKLPYKPSSMVACPPLRDGIADGKFDDEPRDACLDKAFALVNEYAKAQGDSGWAPATVAKKKQMIAHAASMLRQGVYGMTGFRKCWMNAFVEDPQATTAVIEAICASSRTPHHKYHQLLAIKFMLINHPYFEMYEGCGHSRNWDLANAKSEAYKGVDEHGQDSKLGEEDKLFDAVLSDRMGLHDLMTNKAYPADKRAGLTWILKFKDINRTELATMSLWNLTPTGFENSVTGEPSDHITRDTTDGKTIKYPIGCKTFAYSIIDEEGEKRWRLVFIEKKTQENDAGELRVNHHEFKCDEADLIEEVIANRQAAPGTWYPSGKKSGIAKRHNFIYTNTDGRPVAMMPQVEVQYGRCVSAFFTQLIQQHKVDFPKLSEKKKGAVNTSATKGSGKPKGKTLSITSNTIRKWAARQTGPEWFAAYEFVKKTAKGMNHSAEVHAKHYAKPLKKKTIPPSSSDDDDPGSPARSEMDGKVPIQSDAESAEEKEEEETYPDVPNAKKNLAEDLDSDLEEPPSKKSRSSDEDEPYDSGDTSDSSNSSNSGEE